MAEISQFTTSYGATPAHKPPKTRIVPRRKYESSLACDQVQAPPPGPFGSEHLTWYNDTAWIPENRLEDFIEGEEQRSRCNTIFKTRCTEEYLCPLTGEIVRSKKRYWCTFGPKDLRMQIEADLPDSRKYENGKAPLRHTTMTGYPVNRGCQCHFHVTRYIERKYAVKITWVNRNHVDKDKRSCHGYLDKTAKSVNAHVAPRLSRRTINFVERLVRTGVSTTEIVQAHFRNLRNHFRDFWPRGNEPNIRWSRDMMMSPKDVKAIRVNVLRKKVDYNTEDHLAVQTWVANNVEKVFLYQPKKDDNTPFLLGWATDWQIDMASCLGHDRTVAMDATFGTNMWDLHLFTVMVYDDHQNGLPIGWGLFESTKSEQIELFLKSLKQRIEKFRSEALRHPEWKPKSFIIDVAPEEILALRSIFPGVPINLCFWHVRRAWTKNLLAKVKDPFARAEMNRDLRDLMYHASEDHIQDSTVFMEKWRMSQTSFIEYFDSFWHPKLERWMKKFRAYAHQNQNTNGAIERWHHTLKMHLRTEKATKSGRSVVWLLGMLTEDLEHFYWCMLALKHQGAIRNHVKEGYVWASIHKARTIQDSQVRYLDRGPDGVSRVEVTTYKEDGEAKIHIVENYNKDDRTCTCGHSEQGNTCKHQIKVLLLDGYTKMKLFNLLGTKWGSCCGGLEYEYETLAVESVDGTQEIERCPPDEVDISFPMRGFQRVQEEEVDDDAMVEYHEYKVDYFLGLVQSGYSLLEKMGPQIQNQVVVKLREWLEWIKNEEAIVDPPQTDQFPLLRFSKQKGSENSLKRKKDYVEQYWEKKPKGKRARKAKGEMESADTKPSTEKPTKKKKNIADDGQHGWERVKGAISLIEAGENTDEIGDGDLIKAADEHAPGNLVHTDGASQVTDPSTKKMPEGQLPCPFVRKTKRVESDQQMLDRLARESLNLNVVPMDYEARTPPESTDVVAPQEKGKGRVKPLPKKTRSNARGEVELPTQGSVCNGRGSGSVVSAPKPRGRPLGSKNKAKTAGGARVVEGARQSALMEVNPNVTSIDSICKARSSRTVSCASKENLATMASLQGFLISHIPANQTHDFGVIEGPLQDGLSCLSTMLDSASQGGSSYPGLALSNIGKFQFL